jgi:hypothetical protein
MAPFRPIPELPTNGRSGELQRLDSAELSIPAPEGRTPIPQRFSAGKIGKMI